MDHRGGPLHGELSLLHCLIGDELCRRLCVQLASVRGLPAGQRLAQAALPGDLERLVEEAHPLPRCHAHREVEPRGHAELHVHQLQALAVGTAPEARLDEPGVVADGALFGAKARALRADAPLEGVLPVAVAVRPALLAPAIAVKSAERCRVRCNESGAAAGCDVRARVAATAPRGDFRRATGAHEERGRHRGRPALSAPASPDALARVTA
mmetsp:Transcript_11211/g.33168  ORF Transcript_11211/g.33168 Transcript_11211/m.33168 type:complete len:211 (+) Transcript_11211:349-981(+)